MRREQRGGPVAEGWQPSPEAAELWAGVFGSHRPVCVEIGCGRGEFLVRIATRAPQCNYVGVERSWGRLRPAEERVTRAGLENIRLVAGDAACIVQVLPDRSVAAYYVLFPDPWWKRRHHRRRLFQPPFVEGVARTLVPGGTLDLITDVPEYLALARRNLARHPQLRVVEPSPLPVPATTFARKAMLRGHEIVSLRCERR